jgi:hypothetical protein
MPSHLPPYARTTKAGPSRSSGFRRLHRYYEPLGLPLDTAGLHIPPTWAAEEGLPSSAPGCPCVLASLPRECPAPLRDSLSAVCCLHPEMTGSATPPFGFLSHEAAKFTLPHWARRVAPLVASPSAPTGLSTLRSDAALSGVTRSLLRGAPALTAAGLAPASLMQHLDRPVQTRSRSGRTIGCNYR